MKILITGGAGFIASHIVDSYLAAGHEIAVLDNLSTGKRGNLPAGIRLFEVDISDAAAVRAAVLEYGPEMISHHAAQVSVVVSVSDPTSDASRNIIGTINVLEAAAAAKVKRVIYASSGGTVYGVPEHLPAAETAAIDPQSPYALSKFTGEQYLRMYARLRGFEATVLRYSNVYGPRQDPHGEAGVCAIFSERLHLGQEVKIFGDGSQVRDYVFVSDVTAANLAALTSPAGTYNIATGAGTSTRTVFDTVANAVHYAGQPQMMPARPGEIQAIILDPSLAKKTLGWEPKTSFAEGIAQTAAWYVAKQA